MTITKKDISKNVVLWFIRVLIIAVIGFLILPFSFSQLFLILLFVGIFYYVKRIDNIHQAIRFFLQVFIIILFTITILFNSIIWSQKNTYIYYDNTSNFWNSFWKFKEWSSEELKISVIQLSDPLSRISHKVISPKILFWKNIYIIDKKENKSDKYLSIPIKRYWLESNDNNGNLKNNARPYKLFTPSGIYSLNLDLNHKNERELVIGINRISPGYFISYNLYDDLNWSDVHLENYNFNALVYCALISKVFDDVSKCNYNAILSCLEEAEKFCPTEVEELRILSIKTLLSSKSYTGKIGSSQALMYSNILLDKISSLKDIDLKKHRFLETTIQICISGLSPFFSQNDSKIVQLSQLINEEKEVENFNKTFNSISKFFDLLESLPADSKIRTNLYQKFENNFLNSSGRELPYVYTNEKKSKKIDYTSLYQYTKTLHPNDRIIFIRHMLSISYEVFFKPIFNAVITGDQQKYDFYVRLIDTYDQLINKIKQCNNLLNTEFKEIINKDLDFFKHFGSVLIRGIDSFYNEPQDFEEFADKLMLEFISQMYISNNLDNNLLYDYIEINNFEFDTLISVSPRLNTENNNWLSDEFKNSLLDQIGYYSIVSNELIESDNSPLYKEIDLSRELFIPYIILHTEYHNNFTTTYGEEELLDIESEISEKLNYQISSILSPNESKIKYKTRKISIKNKYLSVSNFNIQDNLLKFILNSSFLIDDLDDGSPLMLSENPEIYLDIGPPKYIQYDSLISLLNIQTDEIITPTITPFKIDSTGVSCLYIVEKYSRK